MDTIITYNCMNVKKKRRWERARGLSWHYLDEDNTQASCLKHKVNHRLHILLSPAHIEIHFAQIPARDNSLILPCCSLPDLCPPQRSTDNLHTCSGGEVFFLTLKPSKREKDAGSAKRLNKNRKLGLGKRDKKDILAPELKRITENGLEVEDCVWTANTHLLLSLTVICLKHCFSLLKSHRWPLTHTQTDIHTLFIVSLI